MKALAICGDHPRNCYLVKKLLEIKKIELLRVILFKRDKLMPTAPNELSEDLKKLWSLHFEKRDGAENKRFNFRLEDIYDSNKIIKINNTNDLKESSLAKQILDLNLDICFTSGIPIIREEVMKILPIFTINLHLGLIPHYKGSITMFWPFYFLQPTMAGTTFHIIDKYVDTGEILHNNVPKLEMGDGMHDVASKAVIEANNDLKLVVEHVEKRIKNSKAPIKDPTLRFKGKLFLKSDWKPEMLRKIYESYNDKIVDLYLKKEISSPIPTLKQIVE